MTFGFTGDDAVAEDCGGDADTNACVKALSLGIRGNVDGDAHDDDVPEQADAAIGVSNYASMTGNYVGPTGAECSGPCVGLIEATFFAEAQGVVVFKNGDDTGGVVAFDVEGSYTVSCDGKQTGSGEMVPPIDLRVAGSTGDAYDVSITLKAPAKKGKKSLGSVTIDVTLPNWKEGKVDPPPAKSSMTILPTKATAFYWQFTTNAAGHVAANGAPWGHADVTADGDSWVWAKKLEGGEWVKTFELKDMEGTCDTAGGDTCGDEDDTGSY